MKKIAIVTNTSWNILNFRASLIKELQKEYEILLVAPTDDYTSRISKLAPTTLLKNLSRKGTNPVSDLKLVKELKDIYTKNQIDLALHFTIKPNIYGSMAAKMVNIPSIAVVTGLGYTFLSSGITAKIAKQLYKQAFKRNSLTLFQNADDRDLFLKEGMVDKDRSKVVYGSGIDVSFFKPEKKTEWGEGFHFLFVGRLLYDKGVRELFKGFINSFGDNESVQLHIAGGIDEGNPSTFSKKELDEILAKHGNIKYYGHVEDVRSMIANSDCVVLPSYREGLPRVMLEAIAMEKPIIATDVAGCRDVIVNNENGLLVHVEDDKDLSAKMETMVLFSPEQRKLMGVKGRRLAIDKFSTAVINKQYTSIIATTIRP